MKVMKNKKFKANKINNIKYNIKNSNCISFSKNNRKKKIDKINCKR